MNTPHLWFEPPDFSTTLMGAYNRRDSPDHLLFFEGKPLGEGSPPPIFEFAAPRSRVVKLDVLPNAILVPLISSRVATVLARLCPEAIELIPAQINTRDRPINDYFLLNVLAEISGIDHSRSQLTMLPGGEGIMTVDRLRYRAGAMGRHHLARERDYSVFLWVSEEFVKTFAKEKIIGCSFEPPELIHP